MSLQLCRRHFFRLRCHWTHEAEHLHTLGQAEGGDVRAHEASGLIELFEDGDLVAERHEIVRDRERRGASANAGDALAIFLERNFRSRWAISTAIAGAAENCRENVRFPVEHVGFGVAAVGDEADVFGDVGLRGAGPLAGRWLLTPEPVVGALFIPLRSRLEIAGLEQMLLHHVVV